MIMDEDKDKATMYEVWSRDPEEQEDQDMIKGRFFSPVDATHCFDDEVERAIKHIPELMGLPESDFLLVDSDVNDDSYEDAIAGEEVKVLKATDLRLKDGVNEVNQFTIVLLKKEYELGKF